MHICTHTCTYAPTNTHAHTHTHTASPCTQSVVPSAGLSRSAWQPGSPSEAYQCRRLSQSESHCPPHPPHACTSSGGFGRTVHKTQKTTKNNKICKHTQNILYTLCTYVLYVHTYVPVCALMVITLMLVHTWYSKDLKTRT